MSEVLFACVVPGEPVSKERPRTAASLNPKTGKLIYRTVTPEKTIEAEQVVAATAMGNRGSYPSEFPLTGNLALDLAFYEGPKQSPVHRQDWDNLAKLVGDALNGVIWEDDRQIVRITVHVFRGSYQPHTKIIVRRA